MPALARARAAARPDAAAAGGRAAGPAELRLPRLARAVHQPGAARPAPDRRRGQPGVGGGRDRAGLPAVPAPRLHRPRLRRVGPPRLAGGVLPLAGAGRRHRRGRRRRDARPRAPGIEQAKVQRLARHGVRPPLPACRPRSSTAPTSPRRSCRPPRPATRAASGSHDQGPGNDWRCVVSWHLPASTAAGRPSTSSTSPPDGRYVADGDGPKEVNGYFLVRTPIGDAPNPLWQFDGNVELLATTPKG